MTLGELNRLTSEELLRLLLATDSDDAKIKNILLRRKAGGQSASFTSFSATNGPEPEITEDLSTLDTIYDQINSASTHELAKLMIKLGYRGEGMKREQDTVMEWIELAAVDRKVDEEMAGFEPAENFWAAARKYFKRWVLTKKTEF